MNANVSLSAQRDAVNSATSLRGLNERGRALEDRFFHDRDRELLAKLRATLPVPAAKTEPKADPESGCFDDCECCPNPHSPRLLEELWFEQHNREAIDKMRKG